MKYLLNKFSKKNIVHELDSKFSIPVNLTMSVDKLQDNISSCLLEMHLPRFIKILEWLISYHLSRPVDDRRIY